MAIQRLLPGWRTLSTCVLAACASAGALRAQTQAAARPDSTARDSTPAILIGRVIDSAGVGLAGAEITMLKSDKVYSVSGDSGAFRLTGLPPGTVVFNVRRIGYEAATFTAVLKAGRRIARTFSSS